MNTQASQLIARLTAASTTREKNKILREMVPVFHAAAKAKDYYTSEALCEKFNNYAFDISPYIPR